MYKRKLEFFLQTLNGQVKRKQLIIKSVRQ